MVKGDKDAFREDADLHSYVEFSKEFIAEVLEAEKKCKMGLCRLFNSVDDLLASLEK